MQETQMTSTETMRTMNGLVKVIRIMQVQGVNYGYIKDDAFDSCDRCVAANYEARTLCVALSKVSCREGRWEAEYTPHNPYVGALRHPQADSRQRVMSALNWLREQSRSETTADTGEEKRASYLRELEELDRVFKAVRPGYASHVKEIHPAIRTAIEKHDLGEPKDFRLMIAENPAVAEDGERVAYWQTRPKMEKGIRTVTAIGKYLRRHYPKAQDHVLRDIAALAKPAKYEIWTSSDKIVEAAMLGPTSCMKWKGSEEYVDNLITGKTCHPYRAYHPSHGWSVAVRLKGNTILGRALLHGKVYVRSFAAADESDLDAGYSNSDEGLQAWLKSQGYTHKSCWPEGTPLGNTKSLGYGQEMLPYLDGGTDTVTREDDKFIIDSDGEIQADHTDGSFEEDCWTCDHCEESFGSHQGYQTTWDNGRICQCCVESDYHYAIHRNGLGYLARCEDTIEGRNGDYYYTPHLDAMNMFVVGGYAVNEDEAIEIGVTGEYILRDEVADEDDEYPVGYRYVEIEGCAVELSDAVWCIQEKVWVHMDEAIEVLDGEYIYCNNLTARAYFEGLTPEDRNEWLKSDSSHLQAGNMAVSACFSVMTAEEIAQYMPSMPVVFGENFQIPESWKSYVSEQQTVGV